jgi:hypothetical protein
MFAELSGLLFLYIIVVLNLASVKYGYDVFGDSDAETMIRKVSSNPRKFRIGVLLVVTEHVAIILLAIMLFIAFNAYSLLLGIVWLTSRVIEGAIQLNNKRRYIRLADLATIHQEPADMDSAIIEQVKSILDSKNATFAVAQALFSIGTLAYSAVFVLNSLIPVIIGWLGIIASIIYGLGNVIHKLRPGSRSLWGLGGLLIFIFELVIGGWLLLAPTLLP